MLQQGYNKKCDQVYLRESTQGVVFEVTCKLRPNWLKSPENGAGTRTQALWSCVFVCVMSDGLKALAAGLWAITVDVDLPKVVLEMWGW